MAFREQKTEDAKTSLPAVEQFLSEAVSGTAEVVAEYRKSAFQKAPLLFGALVVFGGVTTAFGFEHLLQETPFFRENPLVPFLIGLLTLAFTGRLYKRLS